MKLYLKIFFPEYRTVIYHIIFKHGNILWAQNQCRVLNLLKNTYNGKAQVTVS
jgi:hypothetical protein